MSKFFKTGDTSSESDSSSSSESEVEQKPKVQDATAGRSGVRKQQWADEDSSSDEDTAKRVVRSHKDKQ